MKTKTKTNEPQNPRGQWLGVVFFYSSLIWAHGSTQEEAAEACAKQAKRDLKHLFKKGAKVEWRVNLYAVNNQDWSYDQELGIIRADGSRAALHETLKLYA